MSKVFDEICSRMEDRYTASDLVEYLNISVPDLLDAFEDRLYNTEGGKELLEEIGIGEPEG